MLYSSGAEEEAALLELSLPLVSIPRLAGYSEIFAVIEARERSVQSLRGFLASMGYIRGNARALPADGLRRSRSKLARMLARIRAHTTVAVEMITEWQREQVAGASDDESQPPTSLAPATDPPEDSGASKAVNGADAAVEAADANADGVKAAGANADGVKAAGVKVTDAADGVKAAGVKVTGVKVTDAADGVKAAGVKVTGVKVTDAADGVKAAGVKAAGAKAASVKAAESAAVRVSGHVIRLELARLQSAPTFYWLGWNYLLKMATDLAFLPIPIENDPLLLVWWRYNAPDVVRDMSLRMPPFTITRPELFASYFHRPPREIATSEIAISELAASELAGPDEPGPSGAAEIAISAQLPMPVPPSSRPPLHRLAHPSPRRTSHPWAGRHRGNQQHPRASTAGRDRPQSSSLTPEAQARRQGLSMMGTHLLTYLLAYLLACLLTYLLA